MTGGNTPKPSSNKAKPPETSTSKRKPASGSGDSKSKPGNDAVPATTNTTQKPPTSTPNPKPSKPPPKPGPDIQSGPPPYPFRDPPPPPAYGFHLLERRSIVLADGSERSYYALPPNYQDFNGPELRAPGLGFERQFGVNPDLRSDFGDRGDEFIRSRDREYWISIGNDGHVGGSRNDTLLKRKFGNDDGFERQRRAVLEHGNAPGTSSLYMEGRGGEEMRPVKYTRSGGFEGNVVQLKHDKVDQSVLKKSFLLYLKLIYENPNFKRSYLANGKKGRLQCLACNRTSKDFPDTHTLIMHAYNSDSGDLLVEHLAFHKALCVLMGWNYMTPPDNSKSYQILSADEAAANQYGLILWPPFVIIHNTIRGKRADGHVEGLGNKAMDNYLRDIGFCGGKSRSLYSKDGHLGTTLVKFESDQSGLVEAMRLAEYFEKDNRGRRAWAYVQSSTAGMDDENNPDLVKVDQEKGRKKRVFYGYLGMVSDFDKIDKETRRKKKVSIESLREFTITS